MTHGQFEKLVELITLVIKNQDTNLKDAILVEKKMGIVLHQSCQGCSTYSVSNHFGVSVAIVTMFTIDVCQTLVNYFYTLVNYFIIHILRF